MLITLLSIIKHTKEALNVFVITMDLTDENEVFKPVTESDREILENAIKQKNSESKVTLVDATKMYRDWRKCVFSR